MLVNILVRTSKRPRAFKRMWESIMKQTYSNIRVIISYDNPYALRYIPKGLNPIRVHKDLSKPYFYDDYVNILKAEVNEGYFFVLDDSDVLSSSNVISELVSQLNGEDGILCQFRRINSLKPSNELVEKKEIIMGKVGMPCLVLRHEHKDLVDLDGSVSAADFHWIKAISEKVNLKFIKLSLVTAGRRDFGKME